ncbi:unnamed protein product [Miscanthus lutarioriparius]|uniref:Protein kinase domain-containing protein n=1 Tax=Miscanthus lutarioriparius TaxID=422564 RepID=A0A811SLH7_9POAL|nr:unnamed protein product [Miscanthus lutarioriparius]
MVEQLVPFNQLRDDVDGRGTWRQCRVRSTASFQCSPVSFAGGFGAVYKGVLPDGTVVAVKRTMQRMQSPHVDVEFRSEIKIMARMEHQSLVRFYAYMECGEERIVVVEYVPNGTLRERLDRCNGRFLDFGTQLDIAIDVAHAVTYLHMYSDHPIIHRDIKFSNILLTDSLRAKVADLGFARLGAGLGAGAAGEATHVTTQVKGTAGYLDPEYLKACQLTDRSDVYSFGVLIVELASARRPIETKRELKERLTSRWAMAGSSAAPPPMCWTRTSHARPPWNARWRWCWCSRSGAWAPSDRTGAP